MYNILQNVVAEIGVDAPGHDDMPDSLANNENAELKKNIVCLIARCEEPKSGGCYRKMRGCAPAGRGLFGR